MQETDAEQLTVQSRNHCSSSDDHIPIFERKWEDITANEFSHEYEFELQISTFVGKWVRHENRRDREADGAIHWRLIRQKLKFTLTKQGGDTFLERLDQSYPEGRKQDTIAVLPEFLQHIIVCSCYSRTHWVKHDRTRVAGSCRHTFQLETFLISPRMLIQFEVNLGGGTHCWEKRKPRRATDCVLHSLGSLRRRD